MSVGEAFSWEALPTLPAVPEWRWQTATATTMREPVQAHDSHCGLLFLPEVGGGNEISGNGGAGGGGGTGTAALEKKKGEESRSACLCHVHVDIFAHVFLQLSSFKDMAS